MLVGERVPFQPLFAIATSCVGVFGPGASNWDTKWAWAQVGREMRATGDAKWAKKQVVPGNRLPGCDKWAGARLGPLEKQVLGIGAPGVHVEHTIAAATHVEAVLGPALAKWAGT